MNKIYSKDTSYNNNLYIRESHNCYNYFLNLKNYVAYKNCKEHDYNKQILCLRAQPGAASGYNKIKKSDINCKEILNRTIDDNKKIKKIKKGDRCNKNYYKAALVVDPYDDFHYYRLNDDGKWSHKPGRKMSTIYDADNKIIKDPETANRNYGVRNYKNFCSYLCVPRTRKKMKMYNESRIIRRLNTLKH
jgi:hypothetical protein